MIIDITLFVEYNVGADKKGEVCPFYGNQGK